MKTKCSIWWFALAVCGALSIEAQTTVFTYQGRLTDGANSAEGIYDLRFALHDMPVDGVPVAGPSTNTLVPVTNGLFTVQLDFGSAAFHGPDRWLEIGVRTNGASVFTTLTPRQFITSTPHALYAAKATTADIASSVSASNINGAISHAQLPSDVLLNGESGVTLSGAFNGNGGGLTNVNALTLGGVGAGAFWRIDGNAGTSPASFIGTTDKQPFEIRVDGYRGLRLEPRGIVPGVVAPTLVGGYYLNTAGNFDGAVIAGGGAPSGAENVALGNFSFIGAGTANRAAGYSAVVAGAANSANGQSSFIGGGGSNTNDGNYSFIGGGLRNQAGSLSAVAGGIDNSASGGQSTVAGGGANHATGANSFIGGGENNSAASFYATVAGGKGNTAGGAFSTIGGGGGFNLGDRNNATADFSTVAGGIGNAASGVASTVGAGAYNRAAGQNSVVGGGSVNLANGQGAVVPGGENNIAEMPYSFAAGQRAKANHRGAFVWADSQAADFNSTSANQFSVRAAGGFYLDGLFGVGTSSPGAQVDALGAQATGRFTSQNSANGSVLVLRNLSPSPFYLGAINFEDGGGTPGQIGYLANGTMIFRSAGADRMALDAIGNLNITRDFTAAGTINANGGLTTAGNLSFGAQTRQMINLYSTQYGIGVQDSTEYFRSDNAFCWYRGGVHNNVFRNPGGGTELMFLNSLGDLYVKGSFGSLSDRNAKEGFEPVNSREALDKVVALPISKWNYKGDHKSRHIGPMAQDFYAAFGLGADDKHIMTVDADGVALAAIQGLNEKNLEAEGRIEKLEAENSELKARLEKLELLVSKLAIQ